MKEERLQHAAENKANDDWETPSEVFDDLQREFKFTLDPCCTKRNAKAKKYFTKREDGLSRSWGRNTVFVNPPYGRVVGKWVEKSYQAWRKGATVVLLVPASTDTNWFHNFLLPYAELRFIKQRVAFLYKGKRVLKAPFPSMVAILRREAA